MILGCFRKLGSIVSKLSVISRYNPISQQLTTVTSRDIQVAPVVMVRAAGDRQSEGASSIHPPRNCPW